MNPDSQHQAARQAEALLARTLPGPRKQVRSEARRAGRVARWVWERYQVGPHYWQAKHARWALEVATADLAPSTRYRYWLAVAQLLEALGRYADWERHLRGPWRTPGGHRRREASGVGGRPRKG